MQILIIGNSKLQGDLSTLIHPENCQAEIAQNALRITWAHHFDTALESMEYESFDAIILDERDSERTSLDRLLKRLPFTTRVMAIVNKLPDTTICGESGVIFLTPPVKLSDITWFIRSEAHHT